jgi:hypothetical protein
VKFNLCSSHNKERGLVKLDVFYKKMHWFFAGSLMTESLTSQLVLAGKVTGKECCGLGQLNNCGQKLSADSELFFEI